MLRPETPLSPICGETIQNFAPSTIRPSALRAILAVTLTRWKSGVSSTALTWPMVTSLYLIGVLPASMPPAALKTIVTVGPSARMRCAAMPTATSAAKTGTIHTIDSRLRGRGSTSA